MENVCSNDKETTDSVNLMEVLESILKDYNGRIGYNESKGQFFIKSSLREVTSNGNVPLEIYGDTITNAIIELGVKCERLLSEEKLAKIVRE